LGVKLEGTAPAAAGLVEGLVDADPNVVGLVIGLLVVAAVLYVVFGSSIRRQ
jgi:hypothetical protein